MSAPQQALLMGGGGDLFYGNVSLLLHMDGANGSTSFPDNSPSPKTVTSVGSSVSTSVFKYGTGSAFFPNDFYNYGPNGFYLSTPSSTDFAWGTGDVTIECWVYCPVVDVNWPQYFFTTTTSPYVWFYLGANNSGPATANKLVAYFLGVELPGDAAITPNTWYHFAVSKSGTTVRLFINGVQQSTTQTITGSTAGSQGIQIGGTPGIASQINFFRGYIDDFRFTKGVARYTTNFTPPTAPFPNY